MRTPLALLLLPAALASSGCAGALTTKDRPDDTMRMSCAVRTNGESTSVSAWLTLVESKDAERVDLAIGDRLVIRSGKYGAGLSRHKDMYDYRAEGSSRTFAYEATIPTGPKLEMGIARYDGEANWKEFVMPVSPELKLDGPEGSHVSWAPSTTPPPVGEAMEIFVACDDGELPKESDVAGRRHQQPTMTPGVAGRYKLPKDEGGIDVDALLAAAKVPDGAPGDWGKCRELSIVVTRSFTYEGPKFWFGASQCFVESSRTIKLPPRGPAPAPTDSVPAPETSR